MNTITRKSNSKYRYWRERYRLQNEKKGNKNYNEWIEKYKEVDKSVGDNFGKKGSKKRYYWVKKIVNEQIKQDQMKKGEYDIDTYYNNYEEIQRYEERQRYLRRYDDI